MKYSVTCCQLSFTVVSQFKLARVNLNVVWLQVGGCELLSDNDFQDIERSKNIDIRFCSPAKIIE